LHDQDSPLLGYLLARSCAACHILADKLILQKREMSHTFLDVFGPRVHFNAMKVRVEIARDVAASVLFDADRTCCVCREPGRPMQIHHIDENPSNNDPQNLAVLCLVCHEDTQIRGGFGRKLDAAQVRKYRDDWLVRVKARRSAADEFATAHQSGATPPIRIERRDEFPDPRRIANYLRTLPAIRKDTYERAHQLWDTGVTPKMRQGNYDVIDVLEQTLATLTSFYPAGQFGGQNTPEYINAITASFFNWHRSRLEPNGPGTGGTIIGPLVGGCVIDDLERLVVELVGPLSEHADEFDFSQWREKWDVAAGGGTDT
jgi:hypothetical protein